MNRSVDGVGDTSSIKYLDNVDIGKSLKLTSGFPFSSLYFSTEDGIPLIRIRDILTSKIETYYRGPYLPLYVVNKGDILVGMDGDFHIVRWRNGEALLNQRILKVDIQKPEKVCLGFVYYWLAPYLKHVNDITSATTVKHLSTKDIEKACGLIPNVKAQEKIAAILECIDRNIEKTESLILKYQKIKAGLMKDLFTRGVTADGKVRSSKEQAPELYKETPNGWIPKTWDFMTLEECAHSWAMGPRFSAEEYNEYGNVATLRTTDIDQDGYIEYSTMPIAFLPLNGFQNHILKEYDFVITRSGTCGICAVFERFHLPVLPGAFLIRFRFNEKLSEEYIKNFLNCDSGKLIVSRIAEGGVQKNLRGTSLCRLKFPCPKPDEQKRINLRIDAVSRLIKSETMTKEKLQNQKAGLMKDLLSGTVQVNVGQ